MKNICYFTLFAFLLTSIRCTSDDSLASTGTNSSYSSMIAVGNYLYQVDPTFITTYNVTDPRDPVEIDKQNLGFEIETVYHFSGILFVGSARSLYIFEIGDNGIPIEKSETSYGTFQAGQTPCDPVISDGDYAYVTLTTTTSSANSSCFRPEPFNKLLIYDVANISNPILISEREMVDPRGLSIDGNFLFVCDGINGLMVFDKSDIENITEIGHLAGQTTRDVIARDDLLIVIGEDQLRQYDYSDITAIVALGILEF